MKNTILFTILLLFACVSCTKDENSFSYESRTEIVILDENNTEAINILHGETLDLTPIVNDSGKDYSYLWFVYRNNPSIGYTTPRDTLGTSKELHTVIDPSKYILGEPYRITLKVTDNKTGVSAFYFYNMNITNLYGQGWIVLEDKAGIADLSMWLPSGDAVHNIYSGINPSHPILNPTSLSLSRFNVTDDVWAAGRRLYIVGQNDAAEVDLLTMERRSDYGYLFFQPLDIVKPQMIKWSQLPSGGGNLGVIVNNGLLITNFVGGFPGAKKFGQYQSILDYGYDYEIAPFVATARQVIAWNSPLISYNHTVYDQKNKRFYRINGGDVASAFPSTASDSKFDMNNVGLDLVTLDTANTASAYNAIMKDANNNPFLLQFLTRTTEGNSVITNLKQSINAPNILNAGASNIASSTISPHIYYAYQNRLYSYEINSNSSKEVFTFSGNEHVVRIKYIKLGGIGQLVVATWNASESKLYEFDISAIGEVTQSDKEPKGGFAKIVDMEYKMIN